MSDATVAAVILAAGLSTRMGQNKLLLALDGETVVRRALGTATKAGLDPVVVVLGHDAERVRAEIAGMPCVPVVNPNYAAGKVTSLQAGIAEASARQAGAAIVMLADMPFVTTNMLATIIARQQATGAPMIVSRYGDVNAPPMLYARALFKELLALSGEACGKEMLRRHRAEAIAVSWPERALADIDVPDDYLRIRTQLG